MCPSWTVTTTRPRRSNHQSTDDHRPLRDQQTVTNWPTRDHCNHPRSCSSAATRPSHWPPRNQPTASGHYVANTWPLLGHHTVTRKTDRPTHGHHAAPATIRPPRKHNPTTSKLLHGHNPVTTHWVYGRHVITPQSHHNSWLTATRSPRNQQPTITWSLLTTTRYPSTWYSSNTYMYHIYCTISVPYHLQLLSIV